MKLVSTCSLAFMLLSACGGAYKLGNSSFSQTRIKGDSLQLSDASIRKLIEPYKIKLDSQMNEVLNITDTILFRAQPESNLGNFVADAVLQFGHDHHTKHLDLCIVNYGGLRIPSIDSGAITTGRIYELMPFDNQVELLEIKGHQLKGLLDYVARVGGWPVSGARFKIQDLIATQVSIGGEPLDMNKTYLLITSDYLANGGDGVSMLKDITRKTHFNYKIRDILIDHLRDLKKSNSIVHTRTDGRITVAQPERIH